jgi:monosaccharide-transporting ATPase
MLDAVFALPRGLFGGEESVIVGAGPLSVRAWRNAHGVEMLRFQNARGEVTVLPYLGQMIWRARFDGVDLAMQSPFAEPRPAPDILGTYGALLYHSGVFRNGVPGPEDSHPLHGEFPTLAMDQATLSLTEAGGRPLLCLESAVSYLRAFGPHYQARARFFFSEETIFETALTVENRGTRAMDLMYMCHANFAFVPAGEIVQPVPFTPSRTVLRRSLPGHVSPDPAYLARLDALAAAPERLAVLDPGFAYDPELVFYLRAMPADDAGQTHAMLRRPEGDGFLLSYDPVALPFAARWLFADGETKVAAFLLPATCEPEGYSAERRKGHVRALAAGARAEFRVRLGYLDAARAEATARMIARLGG